jgi:hypothetical protein
VHSADDVLGIAGVSHSLTCRADAGQQDCIPDELAWPELLEQFLLGDNAVPLPNEIGQELKDLGPEFEELPRPAQLTGLEVERVFTKHVPHTTSSARLQSSFAAVYRWPLYTLASRGSVDTEPDRSHSFSPSSGSL